MYSCCGLARGVRVEQLGGLVAVHGGLVPDAHAAADRSGRRCSGGAYGVRAGRARPSCRSRCSWCRAATVMSYFFGLPSVSRGPGSGRPLDWASLISFSSSGFDCQSLLSMCSASCDRVLVVVAVGEDAELEAAHLGDQVLDALHVLDRDVLAVARFLGLRLDQLDDLRDRRAVVFRDELVAPPRREACRYRCPARPARAASPAPPARRCSPWPARS